jgi:hypothetical protein
MIFLRTSSRLLALSTLLAAWPMYSSAAEANWVLVSGTANAVEYMDQSSKTSSGGFTKAWVMAELNPARPYKGKTFASMKAQFEYDCKGASFRMLHATLYAGRMGSGEVIASDYVSGKWEPAVPQSVGHTKWKVACAIN